MQITDTIADLLTRIRNANSAKHDSVEIPASNLKKSICQILLDEGYIKNFTVIEDGKQGVIKVTLRGDRMYEFVDRLFNFALPRVRDFKGINPNAFDGRGIYALGLKEQLIFPEIEYDKVDKIRGMDICFVTTANTDEEARELLKLMGAPFAN